MKTHQPMCSRQTPKGLLLNGGNWTVQDLAVPKELKNGSPPPKCEPKMGRSSFEFFACQMFKFHSFVWIWTASLNLLPISVLNNACRPCFRFVGRHRDSSQLHGPKQASSKKHGSHSILKKKTGLNVRTHRIGQNNILCCIYDADRQLLSSAEAMELAPHATPDCVAFHALDPVLVVVLPQNFCYPLKHQCFAFFAVLFTA